MASEPTHKYIVVEGPIGVGKTSLARRLCTSLAAQEVLEHAAQNPFLERFYKNPRAGALPTQLYFLLQRAQQLAAFASQGQLDENAELGPGRRPIVEQLLGSLAGAQEWAAQHQA